MKKYLKYGIVLVVIVLGVLIGVVIYQNNDEKHHIYQENNIVINELTRYEEISKDLDIKRVDHLCDCIWSEHVGYNLPDDLKINNDYGIYVKNSSGEYNVLHDIGYEFIGDNNRKVNVVFSKIEKPFRDYLIMSDNGISKVSGNEVIIHQYKNMYLVEFEYENVFYDIETEYLNEKELLTLIEGIFDDREDYIVINQVSDFQDVSFDDNVRVVSSTDSTINLNVPWIFDNLDFDEAYLVYEDSNDIKDIRDIRYVYSKDNKKLILARSERGELLKDYSFKSDSQASYINGVCMIINQYENRHFVSFENNNFYYIIESTNINQEELVVMLKEIISDGR